MNTARGAALALGVVCAIAAFDAPAGKAHAQGIHFDAPGVHVRIGRHHHHHRYYEPGYTAYGYAPGYYGYSRGPNCYAGGCCPPHYTIQDGICKPYRGF